MVVGCHLPFFPLHGPVEPARVVAGHQTEELVEEDGGGEESAARGRTEHPQHGEEDCDGQHREDLDSRPDDGSKEFVVVRRSEHITVHQLPASLLYAVLTLLVSHVVLGDVLPQGPDDDHGDDAGEEEDHHDGVDDGEPVNLRVRHLQVDVPARGPLDVRLVPLHRVGEVEAGLPCQGHLLGPVGIYGAALTFRVKISQYLVRKEPTVIKSPLISSPLLSIL